MIMNIFSNFVASKLVTFDVSDLPRVNELIKKKIRWKHQIQNNYMKNGIKDSYHVKFQEVETLISEMISRHKDKYQN